MTIGLPAPLNRDEPYWRFVNRRAIQDTNALRVALALQGGGAKGAWQGNFLNTLLDEVDVVPIATFGSSAGAINSILISRKLAKRAHDPFSPAWSSLGRAARRNAWTLLVAWLSGPDDDGKGPRRAPLFPNTLLKDALADVIGTDWQATIFTYLQSCEVVQPLPVGSQPLYSFIAPPSAVAFSTNWSLNQTSPPRYVDPSVAAAASSCLPTIAPIEADGRLWADGGIISNLPIDFTGYVSSIADIVILLVPSSLGASRIQFDFVDSKVLRALRRLQAQLRSDDTTVYCLLEPSDGLCSGLAAGFFLPYLQERDASRGQQLARAFLSDLKAFMENPRQNAERLRHYDLRARELPRIDDGPLPTHPWMDYVNREWRRVPEAEEPRTPLWLTALGGLLFAAALLWWACAWAR
jgi:predicted acylesterase/phospholipase RssA